MTRNDDDDDDADDESVVCAGNRMRRGEAGWRLGCAAPKKVRTPPAPSFTMGDWRGG